MPSPHQRHLLSPACSPSPALPGSQETASAATASSRPGTGKAPRVHRGPKQRSQSRGHWGVGARPAATPRTLPCPTVPCAAHSLNGAAQLAVPSHVSSGNVKTNVAQTHVRLYPGKGLFSAGSQGQSSRSVTGGEPQGLTAVGWSSGGST